MSQTTFFEEKEPVSIIARLDEIEPTEGVQVDPGFVNNVDRLGLLEPVSLYGDSPYKIADGKRRVEAARRLGIEEVPATYHEDATGVLVQAIGVSANFHRSPNPLDEAERIGELLKRGWDEDRMVSVLSWDRAKIRKRLRLFGAPEEIKAGVRAGTIAVSTAEKVANLSPTYQKRAVALFKEQGELLGKDVKAIQQAKRQQQAEAMPEDLFGPVESAVAEKPKGLSLFVMKWTNYAEKLKTDCFAEEEWTDAETRGEYSAVTRMLDELNDLL